MVKKIKYFSFITILTLFISSYSIADNHTAVELDPASSGGAKFVKIPKTAAKEFLKEKGLKEGLNQRANGSHIFIAIGQGSVTATDNSQMIHDARFNAFREAIQNAKSEFVKSLGETIETSTIVSIKENTMPETIAEDAINNAVGVETDSFSKLKKLISLKLDNAMKKEGYDPEASDLEKKEIAEKVIRSKEVKSFFSSTAQSMIGGFQAWTVFEESNPGDRAQFTVIGLWSPKLAKLAESIYFGNLDKVPKGAPNKSIEEQLPLDDPNKLLQSFGAQMYLNENGNRVIVGFGHAAPLFENRGDALSTACDMANDKANQQIVMFSKENIMYSKVLNEIDKSEDFEKEGQKLYRSMQGRDYSLLIEGQAEIKNFVSESIGDFAIKDDRYGATDCVAIRMWSPEGVQASNKTKELLEKTTTGTSSTNESSEGNTTGKTTTQGTTGSDDF